MCFFPLAMAAAAAIPIVPVVIIFSDILIMKHTVHFKILNSQTNYSSCN